MTDSPLITDIDGRGVATVTLNRPHVHNAFDADLIARLGVEFGKLHEDPDIRVVVLTGNGKSFSAGADLNWMKETAAYGPAENHADAQVFAAMLKTLYRLSKPTIALVQGPAYAGGIGLVAACDIAIASEAAAFSIAEVKVGLIPAIISPFVVAAIGPRNARRYVLTAERFSAVEAYRMGLVHQVVPADELAATGRGLVEMILKNGPRSLDAAKDLLAAVTGRPIDDAVLNDTAARIADIRTTDEGQEGVASFLEKRKPNWIVE
jgi:methylglutaconyl-CoA hydratase